MVDYHGQAMAKARPRESMNGVVSIDIAASHWLKSHPIVGDALLMKLYDVSRGAAAPFFSDLCLIFPEHRGATGLPLFRSGFALVCAGEEEVEVAADTLWSRHLQATDRAGNLPGEHPPCEVWRTADDAYILLRAGAVGSLRTRFDLLELERC
jgi:hypothetical protein